MISRSETSRPCVFLDRDGVINVAPPRGEYVLRWEDFQFIPQIVDWIRLFNVLGYLVIVVTNQRCVTLGMITADAIESLHHEMKAALLQRGARIDEVYVCPHGEDVCDCRKPKDGMIRQAVAQWNIDLRRSVMIGDSWRDQELAHNASIPFVLVSEGQIQTTNLR